LPGRIEETDRAECLFAASKTLSIAAPTSS